MGIESYNKRFEEQNTNVTGSTPSSELRKKISCITKILCNAQLFEWLSEHGTDVGLAIDEAHQRNASIITDVKSSCGPYNSAEKLIIKDLAGMIGDDESQDYARIPAIINGYRQTHIKTPTHMCMLMRVCDVNPTIVDIDQEAVDRIMSDKTLTSTTMLDKLSTLTRSVKSFSQYRVYVVIPQKDAVKISSLDMVQRVLKVRGCVSCIKGHKLEQELRTLARGKWKPDDNTLVIDAKTITAVEINQGNTNISKKVDENNRPLSVKESRSKELTSNNRAVILTQSEEQSNNTACSRMIQLMIETPEYGRFYTPDVVAKRQID